MAERSKSRRISIDEAVKEYVIENSLVASNDGNSIIMGRCFDKAPLFPSTST